MTHKHTYRQIVAIAFKQWSLEHTIQMLQMDSRLAQNVAKYVLKKKYNVPEHEIYGMVGSPEPDYDNQARDLFYPDGYHHMMELNP